MSRHLTSEEISAWIIGERAADAGRTGDAERHARDCPRCRAEIERFEGAIGHFRDWYASAPPAVQHVPGRLRRPVAAMAGALAASILAAVLLIHRPAPSAEQPFVRIPYVAPLAPYERAAVVRMNLPAAALIAAGFEVRVPDAGVSVAADVLVGQDGRPYAIRPVTTPISNSDRRTNQ